MGRCVAAVLVLALGCGRIGFDLQLDEDEIAELCATNEEPSATAIGEGTPEYPFLICSYTQLESMATSPRRASYRLGVSLDLSDVAGNHVVIGTAEAPFVGSFDGGGLVISNYRHVNPAALRVGLFGTIGRSASISRLGMENVQVHGLGNVGSFVGWMDGGTIAQVYATGVVQAEAQHVGGIVGHLEGTGVVEDCYSSVAVEGSLSDSRRSAAGVVGHNENRVSRCYATGEIVGYGWVGGLIGVHQAGGTAYDSFSLGNVTSTAPSGENNGFLVGAGGGCENCFYSSSATCTSADPCSEGGVAVDLGADPSYFYSMSSSPLDAWDFGPIWAETTDGLPHLAWQDL